MPGTIPGFPWKGGAGERQREQSWRPAERGRMSRGQDRRRRQAGCPGRAATRTGQRCAPRGREPAAGRGSWRPRFLMQSSDGGGAPARGRGLSHSAFPPLPFCECSHPGTQTSKQLRAGPGRGRRGGRSRGALARPPCARAARPLRTRHPGAPRRGQSLPAESRSPSRPPRRGLRGSPRFPVLFANFAPLPPPPRPGAESRARLGGHGRGPEQGRGAGARSPSPGAAALRGADLPARAPHSPPCSARAPACGWSYR